MSSVLDQQIPDIGKLGMGFETGVMAGRLAALLRQRFAGDESPVATSLGFLDYQYGRVADERSLQENRALLARRRQWNSGQAFDLLREVLQLNELELDLLVVTGLAEQHEGYADIFRSLLPSLTRPSAWRRNCYAPVINATISTISSPRASCSPSNC